MWGQRCFVKFCVWFDKNQEHNWVDTENVLLQFFIKKSIPQTTLALAFLTHIILAEGGVRDDLIIRQQKSPIFGKWSGSKKEVIKKDYNIIKVTPIKNKSLCLWPITLMAKLMLSKFYPSILQVTLAFTLKM